MLGIGIAFQSLSGLTLCLNPSEGIIYIVSFVVVSIPFRADTVFEQLADGWDWFPDHLSFNPFQG